jgi:hypothetical protein
MGRRSDRSPVRAVDRRSPVDWRHPLNRGLVSWWAGLPGRAGGGTLRDLCRRHDGTLTGFTAPSDAVTGLDQSSPSDTVVYYPTGITGTTWTVELDISSSTAEEVQLLALGSGTGSLQVVLDAVGGDLYLYGDADSEAVSFSGSSPSKLTVTATATGATAAVVTESGTFTTPSLSPGYGAFVPYSVEWTYYVGSAAASRLLVTAPAVPPHWVPGPTGTAALRYSGTEYVALPTGAFDSHSAGTIAATVTTGDFGSLQTVLAQTRSGNDTNLFQLGVGATPFGNAGQVYVQSAAGGWNDLVLTTGALTAGRRTRVCATSTGSTWAIYFDGVAQSLSASVGSNGGRWFSASASGGTNLYRAGYLNATYPYYFKGDVADVRVLDRPYSAAEAWEDYVQSVTGWPDALARVPRVPALPYDPPPVVNAGIAPGFAAGFPW